jgi:hypothetical protein
MPVDIAADTRKVGNALTSVRIDELLVSLAKGMAWGQYDLDKVGMDVAKMMAVPGTARLGDEATSMLDAGFLPTFYHFIDTMVELKLEVKLREEGTNRQRLGDAMLQSQSPGPGRAGGGSTSTSVYSRALDAAYAQKYRQELHASSLMRTRLVPRPAPELLLERIGQVVARLRAQAESQARAEGATRLADRREEIFAALVEEHLTELRAALAGIAG